MSPSLPQDRLPTADTSDRPGGKEQIQDSREQAQDQREEAQNRREQAQDQ